MLVELIFDFRVFGMNEYGWSCESSILSHLGKWKNNPFLPGISLIKKNRYKIPFFNEGFPSVPWRLLAWPLNLNVKQTNYQVPTIFCFKSLFVPFLCVMYYLLNNSCKISAASTRVLRRGCEEAVGFLLQPASEDDAQCLGNQPHNGESELFIKVKKYNL